MQPDLFVIPAPPVLDIPWSDVTRLLLAVEVVSPGTARADRHIKRRHFQEAGVPVYWVVDPDARMVEVWTPASLAPIVEREHLTWSPGDALPLIVPLWKILDDRNPPARSP